MGRGELSRLGSPPAPLGSAERGCAQPSPCGTPCGELAVAMTWFWGFPQLGLGGFVGCSGRWGAACACWSPRVLVMQMVASLHRGA